MTTAPPAALAVRVSVRHPDGDVVERVWCCWRVPPSAADVLQELGVRARATRRCGLRLVVDDAPPDLVALLVAVGFS